MADKYTDEGNAVVEAAQTQDTTAANQSPDNSGESVVVVESGADTNTSPQLTGDEVVTETRGADILPKDLSEDTSLRDVASEATPYRGGDLSDVQIIEMMDQFTRSDIYTKQELKESQMDSELYSAMAYTAQKNRSLAVDEYHLRRADAEIKARHTGWYVAPEDAEVLRQAAKAEVELGTEGITEAKRRKAEGVKAYAESYFKVKGISPKGIRTLDAILKDRNMNVMRMKERTAAASQRQKIKAMEIANLQAIMSSLMLGDSEAEIAAKFRGQIDERDIHELASAYRKSMGGADYVYMAKLNSMTPKEFAENAEPVYVNGELVEKDGKAVYKVKVKGNGDMPDREFTVTKDVLATGELNFNHVILEDLPNETKIGNPKEIEASDYDVAHEEVKDQSTKQLLKHADEDYWYDNLDMVKAILVENQIKVSDKTIKKWIDSRVKHSKKKLKWMGVELEA